MRRQHPRAPRLSRTHICTIKLYNTTFQFANMWYIRQSVCSKQTHLAAEYIHIGGVMRNVVTFAISISALAGLLAGCGGGGGSSSSSVPTAQAVQGTVSAPCGSLP